MRTAFYHMAVWNVQEAGDIINEILDENDHKTKSTHAVKPVSVAEKVRMKAAIMRRQERLGMTSKMSNMNHGSEKSYREHSADPKLGTHHEA